MNPDIHDCNYLEYEMASPDSVRISDDLVCESTMQPMADL